MLILLAERTIRKMSYVYDDDRKDCLQFAMLDLLKYWRNFNPKYPKGWNKIHPVKYKGTMSIDRVGSDSDNEGGLFSI